MEDFRKEDKAKKLDILDQWLKQTLNIGKTGNSQSQSAQQQSANSTAALNSGTSGTQALGKNVAPQTNAALQKGGQPSVKGGLQNPPNQPGKPGQQGHPGRQGGPGKSKNKRGRDKRGRGRSAFSGNFNQRHKFQSALRRADNAQPNQAKYDPHGVLRIIPVGGLDEVGKNTMILEYEDSIFLIDLGFQFPEADMLGVDYVIPDINYLKDKIHKIKGIVVTHGHLDHIGAIPYLLPKLNVPPIFAGKLTMGLIKKQLDEFGLTNQATLNTVNFNDEIFFGKMKVSFFRVTHSIPDSCGLFIETPAGSIVHTGDFKIDLSPAGAQLPPEFSKIAAFGDKNVSVMMSDSTNAMKPGYTISEKKIGHTLDRIIADADGRVIIASFSSQIGRIQQIVDAAVKYGKKIFLSGRSLIDNSLMAAQLGYLKYPQGLVLDVKKSKKHPSEKTIILTTGSQGEPMAALSRMALNEHAQVKIKKGDTVVLSSSPIPGNEMAVVRVINNLSRLGAIIINNHIMDVHASGHGQQEDLKLMFSLVKPKYFVPVHGEYFMRRIHGEVMVHELGFPKEKVVMIENGDVLELRSGELKSTGERVQTNYILVDGMGGGDIGSQVMMDRQILAENGVIVVTLPVDRNSRALKGDVRVETRGFIYMEESQEILNGIRKHATDSYQNFVKSNPSFNYEEAKLHLRESIDQFVVTKIDRQPLILPMIVD
ncbi:ribonuclease J [Candidatus Peregrinibacteria bacterium]|nr:ribonuclease J [Candidatus Peregrinibacteria bacterium]